MSWLTAGHAGRFPVSKKLRALGARAPHADLLVWAGVLVAIGLVVRLPFIFNDFGSSVSGDTALYLEIADSLLAGEGFVTETYRTAGYPLFIAPLSLLPGPTIDAVVIIQHLLGSALAVGVLYAGTRYFGRLVGVTAALLTALSPSVFAVEHEVLSDLLFAAVVFAAAVALAEAMLTARPSLRWMLIAGAMFGIATHVKPSGQVLIAAAPLALALCTRSWRETARGSVVAILMMVLVVAPWVIHNGIKHGQPIVSSQGGSALWLRAFDLDHLPIPTDSADGRFAKHVYEREIAELPPGSAVGRTKTYNAVFQALQRRGDSQYEAAATQGRLALEAIRSHPRAYVMGTLDNIRQYATYNRSMSDVRPQVELDLDHATAVPAVFTRIGWRIAEGLASLVWTLSLALLAVPLLLLRTDLASRAGAAALVSCWAVIVVGGSLTNWVEPRFAVQVAPMQWLLEAAAAAMVVSALVHWRRERAEALP